MTMKRWEASRIEGYTDGGCHGNPGPGGWGWAIYEDTNMSSPLIKGLGGKEYTTNNQMEMTAVIKLLEHCLASDVELDEVFSDSSLVVRGINEWMAGWKSRGWKKAGNKPLLNKELWIQIDNLLLAYKAEYGNRPSFTWVKGHSTDPGNIFVDSLTQVAIAELELEKF